MAYIETSTTEHVTTESSCTPNKDFVKSIPGILKITELVVNVVIWICVGCTHYFSLIAAGGFINFAASISFIFTMIMFILYLFRLLHRLPGPWILIESVFIILSIIFHAIAMLVGLISYSYGGGAIAAGLFCAVNAVVYGVEMFLRFRIRHTGGWTFTATAMDGDIAVVRTVETTSTTVTTHEPSHVTVGVSGDYGAKYEVP